MGHAAVKLTAAVVLAVAVILALLPAASSSSRAGAGAALQRRVETTAMYTAQDLPEKTDVTKGVEEDVTTTGFGAESEREVPTGPDPIHHHGRGPRRHSP